MSAALLGFVGLVVGLLVGNGYLFWVTRRSEIIAALAAASTLRDETKVLIDATVGATHDAATEGRAGSRNECAALAQTWTKQRSALVPVVAPKDIRTLADAILLHNSPRNSLGKLAMAFEGITDVLWQDLQALIFTKFITRRIGRHRKGPLIDQLSQHVSKLNKP